MRAKDAALCTAAAVCRGPATQRCVLLYRLMGLSKKPKDISLARGEILH